MNNQENKKVNNLARLVGDFIRYWGFRKIHGEIWTVLFLTAKPMSCADLVLYLGVSKALVSPALKELEAEGLISNVKSENSKVKRYLAKEDVFETINSVLDRREKPMMKKIKSAFRQIEQGQIEHICQERVEFLGEMIQGAEIMLESIGQSGKIWI